MKSCLIIESNSRSTAGRRFPPAFFALVFCILAGCSHDDAKHGTVTGLVSLDGQLLPKGSIRFTPVDGHVSPAEGAVSDGKYSIRAAVGESRVAISAPKVVGKRKMYETPDSPTVDNVVELLPVQYNSQSTLTFTVAPGAQQQNYDLKSGK